MNSSKKHTKVKAVKAEVKAKPSVKAKKTSPAKAKATKPAQPVKAAAPAAGKSRNITNDCIASRAYTLWEKDGRPQGRDVEYWLQAEQQLKQDSQSFAA
jgi:hypothetical protein